MLTKTKSYLLVENATSRARPDKLEDKSTNQLYGKELKPPNNVIDRKRIEEVLKASDSLYRRIFETGRDPILILDAGSGRITDANPSLCDLLGYSQVELLGKRFWEIGPFQPIAASQAAYRRLQRKEYFRCGNVQIETKGNNHRHVEFVGDVCPINGMRVILCRIHDITTQTHAESELRNANEELENRVKERTAELLNANQLMKQLLDDGKRVRENIVKSRDRLRNLSARLQTMIEEERTRISREIHDELGQVLTALKLDLSSLGRRSPDVLAKSSAKVRTMEKTVGRIIRTVRKISTELRPGILDELGLPDAIEWLAKDFQKRTGIVCTVTLHTREKITDSALSTAIFRIIQEALTNVMRHSAATRVNVSKMKKDNNLVIEVKDNGVGITEERINDSRSLGLTGIRERVLLLRGEVFISGIPGKGTLVRVTLPIG